MKDGTWQSQLTSVGLSFVLSYLYVKAFKYFSFTLIIENVRKKGVYVMLDAQTLYGEGYSTKEMMKNGYPPTFLTKGEKPTPPKIIITIAFKYGFSIVKTIQLIERVVAILENSKPVDIDQIELRMGHSTC